MQNTTKEELKKEFGQYLRSNWDDRETLPVADWWLDKLDLILKEKAERIEKEEWKTNHNPFSTEEQIKNCTCKDCKHNQAIDLAIKIINE